MPSRARKLDHAVARLPSIPKELVEQFLTGPMTGEAINAAGLAFKQALIEASLKAELSRHLGYGPGADKPEQLTNQHNGVTAKTMLSGDGKMRIETPRDRDGSFEPLLLPKHARRFTAFDDSIVALYARGLTVREIQGYLAEAYGHRSQSRPDQHGDRRRAGGGGGVAGPAIGTGVSGRVWSLPSGLTRRTHCG
jgi:putative transposase